MKKLNKARWTWSKQKRCNRCSTTYPRTDEFWSGKGYENGYCRICAAEAENRANRPKENHESSRWLSKKLKLLRERAEKKGLPFDLDLPFLKALFALTHCEFTGLEFAASGPFAKSIDRRDPSRGYVKSNVQMVVWIHNAARGNWGDEALARYVAALVTRRRK